MKSSAPPPSRSARKLPNTVEDVEAIIKAMGGPSIFFYANGEPRQNWFEIMVPLGPLDFLSYIYGDEPTCPKNPSFIITIDRLVVCQKLYWCLTWQGKIIGDPIPVKVT